MPLSLLLKAFGSKPKNSSLIKKIRMAVVGAGRMGQNHARLLSQHGDVELVGIVDQDLSRSQALAKQYRSHAFKQAPDLLGRIDAAVIAVPTEAHSRLGTLFLEAGVACLIEKPLASTLAEAEALMALADQNHCVLQVGHIERFNPAVLEAAHYVRDPQFIEVSRLGLYDPRVAGIGVIMDLMIHDLDIVLFLVGQEVMRVEAFGAKVLSDHEDIAKARLHFANGCIADLSASRISLKKYRQIRIFQKDAYLSLDYAAPRLKIYRKKGPVVKSLTDIEVIQPKLSRQEPLVLELDHFIHCVSEGTTPRVSAKHGRDAIRLAREILDHLKFCV